MFDIAFSELLVIGVVALVVIGPDKLPRIARTAGHLLGKAQRYLQRVKSELNQELQTEGLQSLQEEIRLNLQQVKATHLEVGQVIQHEMSEPARKFQVGQVIRHDLDETEATANLQAAIVVSAPRDTASTEIK